jgi:cell division protein ZapA (FtsZ GTPase activity inhibitor)
MAALNMAHELVKRDSAPRSGASDPLIDGRLRALQERIEAVLDEDDRQLKI